MSVKNVQIFKFPRITNVSLALMDLLQKIIGVKNVHQDQFHQTMNVHFANKNKLQFLMFVFNASEQLKMIRA